MNTMMTIVIIFMIPDIGRTVAEDLLIHPPHAARSPPPTHFIGRAGKVSRENAALSALKKNHQWYPINFKRSLPT